MRRRKLTRCTNKQITLLVDYMTTNKKFANGDYCGPLEGRRMDAQWHKLKEVLKEYGPDKSVEQWKHTWRDLKRKARRSKYCSSKETTEEQPECISKILDIIDPDSSSGIGLEESRIGQFELAVVIEDVVSESSHLTSSEDVLTFEESMDTQYSHQGNLPVIVPQFKRESTMPVRTVNTVPPIKAEPASMSASHARLPRRRLPQQVAVPPQFVRLQREHSNILNRICDLLTEHNCLVNEQKAAVKTQTSAMVTLREEDFGIRNGEVVKKFTWRNSNGFSISVITYGAIIQSIKVPDRNGVVADVVLGFDDLDSYVNGNTPYFGATIGRCANRIAGGSFEIDGVVYELARNLGNNHLHGGLVGFDKVIWNYNVEGLKVTLSYLSKDGEEGYPGDLVTNISIEVLDDNTVRMVFQSSTTKKTVVNLTNHSYFNLAGHQTGAAEIYNHVVAVNADKITETDSESIPTGAFIDVGGTPFDLRVPRRLGELIENSALFDNNFCVTTHDEQNMNFVSRVVHPPSGRTLEVYSDQPGVQLFTANNLPSSDEPPIVGKDSVDYRRHGAFCLETQKYPDAVHHTNFPSVILKPGDLYVHNVHYRFGVDSLRNHTNATY